MPPDVLSDRATPPLTSASPGRRLLLLEGRSFVLGSDNVWYGWGDRLNESFGEDPLTPVRSVTRLPLDEGAYVHFFGHRMTCRVPRGGRRVPQCWGFNNFGQLGSGPPSPPVRVPRDVLGLADVEFIHPDHRFAWNANGVFQWPITISRSPMEVIEYIPQRRRDRPYCAASGTERGSPAVYDCDTRELELEQSAGLDRVFQPIARLGRLTAFYRYDSGVGAVMQDGSLSCWGQCALTLGVPTLHTESLFRPVVGAPPLRYAMSTGQPDSGCGITLRNEVVCWGDCVRVSALGSNCEPTTRPGRWIPPTRIPELTDVVELAMSPRHACALTRRRELWCWGQGILHEIVPEQELHRVYQPLRIDVPNL